MIHNTGRKNYKILFMKYLNVFRANTAQCLRKLWPINCRVNVNNLCRAAHAQS